MTKTRRSFCGGRVCLAALVFAGALGAAGRADDLPHDRNDWIEARTANFLIWSDAGERHTREYAADLEQLRAALAQLDPGLGAAAPVPTYLYVFKNRFALAPYLPLFQGKREELAGYFEPRPTANYMVMDGDARGPGAQIVYHEYLHFLLHSRYAHLPLWLDEGLAEYFSSFHIAEGEARLGLPIEEHIRWLRQNTLLPLPQLVAIDQHSKDYHEGIHQGVFYAESWALTHYLMVGKPERRSQLAQMMKLIEAGTPQDKAFAQAFGDVASLDQELRVYVNHHVFNFERMPLKGAADDGVTVKPLPPAQVLYHLGDLLLGLEGQEPAAAAHFRAALAADPQSALAAAGLGQVEDAAHRWPQALADYEKAVALLSPAPGAAGGTGPAEAAFLHYLLGRSLLNQASQDVAPAAGASGDGAAGDGAPGGRDHEGVRAASELAAATQLAPDFGEAWAQLGLARLAMKPPSPDAVAALATAHRLLPSRYDVALNLAAAYANAGERPKAEAMVERARLAGAPPQDIAQARRNLLLADYNAAAKRANAGDLAGAIVILQRLAATTGAGAGSGGAGGGDDGFHRQVTERLDRLRQAASRKTYGDAYNHAVELANHGDLKGAAAQLEALLAGLPANGATPAAPTAPGAVPAASAAGVAPVAPTAPGAPAAARAAGAVPADAVVPAGAAAMPVPDDIADMARQMLAKVKAAAARRKP